MRRLFPASNDGDAIFEERHEAVRKDRPNVLLQFIFLCAIGVITALLALGIEIVVLALGAARQRLAFVVNSFLFSYAVWIVWGVLFGMVATLVPKHVDDNAIGSGLPQMKSILSGFVINRYLSLRTLISKALGLTAALGAGLCIGKEGPMVHLGSCVANVLCSHFQIFRPFKNDQQTYFNMVSAAVAVGVVSTFGAPVGGVLFSIEVTATYYMVSNLQMALVSAVSACLTFKAFHQLNAGDQNIVLDLFEPTQFEQISLDETILAYALLGVMSGFVGGSFLLFVKRVAVFRRTHPLLKGRRFLNCALTGCATAMITFQFDILRCGSTDVINALFSREQFDWQSCGGPHRFGGSVFFNLLLFLVYKIVFTAVSITLPIPCGVFGPVFIIGAALGRFTGETFGIIFPSLAIKHTAGAFAVVGAAAVSGAVTRTISTAVIVFELTAQLSHMLPVLVAVLLACAVANLMSPSIYEVMMILNDLPYMPHLAPRQDTHDLRATDVMQECDDYLIYQVSTYRDAVRLLRGPELPQYVSIPVVKSATQPVLVGTVQRGALQKAIEAFLKTAEWDELDESSSISAPSQLLREGLATLKKKGSPRRNYTRVANDMARNQENISHAVGDRQSETTAQGIAKDALDTLLQYRDMDLDRLQSTSPTVPAVVDTAPFTLLDTVSFARVHYYFTMLGLSHAFVTDSNGTLQGVLTKDSIVKRMNGRSTANSGPKIGVVSETRKSAQRR